MQTLRQALQDQDLGFLRATGELWGIEATGRDKAQVIDSLWSLMQDKTEAEEVISALPAEAQQALSRLLTEGGRLAAGDFFPQFGPIRSMGPGRRDREKPWRSPTSNSERLYYHGLIGRGFSDSPAGPKEFIFIPIDLRPILQELLQPSQPLDRSQLPAAEPAMVELGSSALLDDATTLLAALRRRSVPGPRLPAARLQVLQDFMLIPGAIPMLVQLLVDQGVISPDPLSPNPAEVASALEAPRNVALRQLCLSWQSSESWHDLSLLDHLETAGAQAPQDPRTIRLATLALFKSTESGQWIDLDAFVGMVKQNYPTFARPGGDFDSWLLRDKRTGNFLQGWDSWDAVDGALLRTIISGPLHWLGAIDLGFETKASPRPVAFRLTRWNELFFDPATLPDLPQPPAVADIKPDGRLSLPRAVPRRLRYQVARLCSWEALHEGQFHYRLRPSAILAAAEQGLRQQHIEKLLNQLSEVAIPPTLTDSIRRLMSQGIEAAAQDSIVLRVKSPDLMDQLMTSKETGRWIKERLGPKAAVIDDKALGPLIEAAARNGILIEPPQQED